MLVEQPLVRAQAQLRQHTQADQSEAYLLTRRSSLSRHLEPITK